MDEVKQMMDGIADHEKFNDDDKAQVGGQAKSNEGMSTQDFDMFMDVNMTLSTEVGRAEIKLGDLLKLTKGAVIELNKLSGEPLDIFANGKLIAYGEVVAVNGKYGIRITGIANKRERSKHTQGSE